MLAIYRKQFPRPDSSVGQPYSFEDKLLLYERKDSKLKTSWQISVYILQSCECSFQNPQLTTGLPALRDPTSQWVAVDFLQTHSLELDDVGSSGVKGFSKTFSAYHMSRVYQAVGQSRGNAFRKNSDKLKDD